VFKGRETNHPCFFYHVDYEHDYNWEYDIIQCLVDTDSLGSDNLSEQCSHRLLKQVCCKHACCSGIYKLAAELHVAEGKEGEDGAEEDEQGVVCTQTYHGTASSLEL